MVQRIQCAGPGTGRAPPSEYPGAKQRVSPQTGRARNARENKSSRRLCCRRQTGARRPVCGETRCFAPAAKPARRLVLASISCPAIRTPDKSEQTCLLGAKAWSHSRTAASSACRSARWRSCAAWSSA
nr:MAG: MC152.1R [Molluscum contagiosum virus]